MNLKEIKEMIALMNENNLVELEIEREGTKIRIKKQAKGENISQGVSLPEYTVEQTFQPQPQVEISKKTEKIVSNIFEIKSPMVGTFYSAAAPEVSPFVEVNQDIEVGQVICIIEAMKLMNEIKSEVKGKIKEILVENGDPVEFGQSLFLIELT